MIPLLLTTLDSIAHFQKCFAPHVERVYVMARASSNGKSMQESPEGPKSKALKKKMVARTRNQTRLARMHDAKAVGKVHAIAHVRSRTDLKSYATTGRRNNYYRYLAKGLRSKALFASANAYSRRRMTARQIMERADQEFTEAIVTLAFVVRTTFSAW